MKSVIGVDGGVSGAIAHLNERGFLQVFDIPTMVMRSTGKRVLDPDAYLALLRTLGVDRYPTYALFERGGEIPFVGKDGKRRAQSGMYPYGFTNGQLFMGARALGASAEIIEPQVWKRYHHLTGKDKEASRAKATELFPAFAFQWENKGHHNRAEAALIAYFGMNR